MRPILSVLLCFACAHTPLPATEPSPQPALEDPLPDDPEIAGVCQPDWRQPSASACPKNAEGQTVLNDRDPAYPYIADIIRFDQRAQTREGGMEARVLALADRLLNDPRTSECARQVCHWHRAMALYGLGHWKEALLEFDSVLRVGSGGPFYKSVRAWFEALAPHVSRRTYERCIGILDGQFTTAALR